MNLNSLKGWLLQAGLFTLNLIKVTSIWLWRATCWLSRITWTATKFLGRCALWVVFFPLGIFRSWLHHTKKRDDRLIEALKSKS